MNKKSLKVLSIGAILGSIMQVGMPLSAEAAVDAYIIKVSQEIYSYNKDEVIEDFLNYKAGYKSNLYNDFYIKLKMANGFYSFHDKKTGYIKYEDVENKYLESKLKNKKFDAEKFTESNECKLIEVNWTKKAIMTIEGNVRYITPNDVNNSTSNNVKDDKNLNNKENENSHKDNEGINNISEDKLKVYEERKHKHKHRHTSSEDSTSKTKIENNEVEEKEKAEKERLAKIEADKQKAEKEKSDELKQEELKKQQEEKEKAEKERLAKIEADKQKAEKEKSDELKQEELKKQQEEKAEKERLAKIEADKQKAEKEKSDELKQEELRKQQEEKEKAEKERLAKIEADKQKAEAEKQKSDELKQEELRKQQEEKEKKEKAEQEAQLKKEQERLQKIQEENNALIEEAKNNIKLEDLSNVKDNLRLPTRDSNGVEIEWKSSDESVIKYDGTVKRPNADEKDKKVTLIATFTKDSATSTKEFEAIVKAQEKLPVKTEEEEIAELLKADKKIEVNKPEKFDKVVKEAIKQLKPSFTVMIPYDENQKYNFNNFNKIMLELGGHDYGKPEIRTNGGQVQIVNGKMPMTIQLNYRRDIDEVRNQKQATEAEVKRIIKEVIKDNMTPVQKELALHDYVVKHADYNMEGLNKRPADLEDHSAYGVLVLGKGVCESYSKAMHLLLNEAGIECKYATGYKKNRDGRQGGGHAWNIVKLDNEWYNLDATWDDPVSDRVGRSDKDVVVSPVIHTYFNVTDDIFNKDHIRGEYEQKNYPRANGTKYSYDNLDIDEFMNDGTKVPKVTTREEFKQKLIEALKTKKTTVYVRFKGFKMNQQEVMNILGEVARGNLSGSYSVSPTDENHVYCSFIFR
ncbi:transglutaminase [Clostridium botulinum]|nr:transglutaminase [Clostridium botulinum]